MSAQTSQELVRQANNLYEEGNRRYAMHTDLDISEAISLYSKGLSIAKQSRDRRAIGRGEFLMGATFDALGKIDQARDQYRKAYSHFVALGDSCWQANCLQGLYMCYYKLSVIDSAIYYHNAAIDYVWNCNDPELKIRVLSDYSLELNQPARFPPLAMRPQLEELKQMAMAIENDTAYSRGYKNELWNNVLSMDAMLQSQANNADSAFRILQRLDTILMGTDSHLRIANYFRLKEMSFQLGDLGLCISYSDSLAYIYWRANKQDMVDALQRADEFEAALEAERARIAEENLAQTRMLFGGLLVFSIVLAIMAVVLWRNNRLRRRTNIRLLNSEAEKDVLLHELHHRVKNNLQMLSAMLSLQANRMEDTNARDVLLQSRRRVEAIATVHRNLHSGEITVTVNLADFLAELCRNVASETSELVKLDLRLVPLLAKQEVAVPLGILINELITNSIKYAMHPEDGLLVSLDLQTVGDTHAQLVYTDNGPGLPPSFNPKDPKHFGIRLIHLMAAQLKGELVQERNTWRLRFTLDN